MFDGKVQTSRKYGGSRRDRGGSQSRGNIVEQARLEREGRALEKQRKQAAVCIQALVRRALSNVKCKNMLRQEFDTSLNNINKMSALLKSAGKTFIVPSAVMQKCLRTFLMFFDPSTDAQRVGMVMSLYLKYILEEESKLELLNEELRGSWVQLLGRLYELSFRLLRENAENNNRNNNNSVTMDVIRSIFLASTALCGAGNERIAITAMAPLFIGENCSCLKVSLQQGDEETTEAVMLVLVEALKGVPIAQLFQQLAKNPHDQQDPWVRVIWALTCDVLSIEKLTVRASAKDLLHILGAEGGIGWRMCLFLLLHRLRVGTQERAVKQNVLANYFAHIELEVASVEQVCEVLWPSTLSLNCEENSSFAWLRLVDQVLPPSDAAPRSSTSMDTILRVLVNKELIACSLRRGLQSSSMDTATAVMSLYGKILLWHEHDERVTQAILGTRFSCRELNGLMWAFLRQSLNLGVSTTGEAIFKSALDALYPGQGGNSSHSRILYCMLLFSRSLYHELWVMDDEDFLASGCVVGEAEMTTLIGLLNAALLRFYRLAVAKDVAAAPPPPFSSPPTDKALRQAVHTHVTKLYNQVFEIDDRRRFFPDQRIWQWTSIPEQDLVLGSGGGGQSQSGDTLPPPPPLQDGEEEGEGEGDLMDVEAGGGDRSPAKRSPLRNPVTWKALLDHPQVIPFKKRVAIFQDLLEEDKSRVQGDAFKGWRCFIIASTVRFNKRFAS